MANHLFVRGLYLTATAVIAGANICACSTATSRGGVGPLSAGTSGSATGGSAGNSSSGGSGGSGLAGGSGAAGAADSLGGTTSEGGAGGSSAVLGTEALDRIVFGDSTSEANHGLKTSFGPLTDTTMVPWNSATPAPSDPSATPASETVTGGLGASARRLLPRTPNGDVYGGQMTFTMTIDPVNQNYFTVKMWGGDDATGFLILDIDGKEVGTRHGGGGLEEDPLYFGGAGWYQGRFFYRTV